MPARTSKEVTDRQQSCGFVLTALLRQGARVAAQLLTLVQPHLEEGDEAPGFFPVVVALARKMGASLDQLVGADEALYEANARYTRLREQQTEFFSKLARKVARLRLTLINQYVAPRLVDLGLESETARSPRPLLRQADRIVKIFAGEDLEKLLGESIFQEPANLRSQAAELDPLAGDLRRNLLGVDEARRALDEAKVARDKLKDQHDEIFLRSARTFEDFCRLAGEKELADKVRPSEKRPGRREQDPPEDGAATGGEDGESSDSSRDAVDAATAAADSVDGEPATEEGGA